jgi:hypothetical protein
VVLVRQAGVAVAEVAGEAAGRGRQDDAGRSQRVDYEERRHAQEPEGYEQRPEGALLQGGARHHHGHQ